MIGGISVAFAMSLALGFLLVDLQLPLRHASWDGLLYKVALSVGLGMGISSCIFFLCYYTLAPNTEAIRLADLLCHLAAISSCWLLRYRRRQLSPSQPGQTREMRKGITVSQKRVLGLLCFFAFLTCLFVALQKPYGGHDSMGIWNLRARHLAQPQQSWQTDLKAAGTHPDYPLLVPGAIARIWLFAGKTPPVVPITYQLLLTFATVFLILFGLRLAGRFDRGFIAAAVLLGTPYFLREGAGAQCADVSISYFFLASVILLALKDQQVDNPNRLSRMAGVCLGLATWTKNEGLLFMVAVIGVRLVVVYFSQGYQSAVAELKHLLMGIAPVFAVTCFFKLQLAPTNDMIAGQGAVATVERLTDVPRYFQILVALIKELLSFSRWQIYPIAIGLYLYFAGVDWGDKRIRLFGICMVCIIGAMLSGISLVYLTAYLDLSYTIRTSLHRLLLQLYPLSLFTAFFIVKPKVPLRPSR